METLDTRIARVRKYEDQLLDLEERLRDAKAHGRGEEIPILKEQVDHKRNCVKAAKEHLNVFYWSLPFYMTIVLIPLTLPFLCQRYKEPKEPRTLARDRSDYRRVFLSHTGQDAGAATFAALVEEELHRQQIDAFLDSRNIVAGDPWANVIEGNARNCQIFVAIISPKYFLRYWCLHELDLAMRSNRKIIPVFHSCKGPPKVDQAMKRQLREVLIKKMRSEADWDELERWYRNVANLANCQGIRNYSTHKHNDMPFRDNVVSGIRRALRNVPH